MVFETAKTVSFIIHLILVFSVFSVFLLHNWRKTTLINLMYKLYICIFVWYFICVLFDGCPVTYLENYISYKIYGKYFYPDYNFSKSIVSTFIKDPSHFIPLFFVITYQLITYQWRLRIESRKNM